MRTEAMAFLVGALLFVTPVPGTFVLGFAVMGCSAAVWTLR